MLLSLFVPYSSFPTVSTALSSVSVSPLWSETQSCPTLCDPVDYSLPGSSVYEILQVRILEWVTVSFSRRSSQSRDRTQVSTSHADSLPSQPPASPLLPCKLTTSRGGVGWARGGKCEGTSKGRGHMNAYGWLMSIYVRNQHNIIKHFSSN